jgi:hypothetical protein
MTTSLRLARAQVGSRGTKSPRFPALTQRLAASLGVAWPAPHGPSSVGWSIQPPSLAYVVDNGAGVVLPLSVVDNSRPDPDVGA